MTLMICTGNETGDKESNNFLWFMKKMETLSFFSRISKIDCLERC